MAYGIAGDYSFDGESSCFSTTIVSVRLGGMITSMNSRNSIGRSGIGLVARRSSRTCDMLISVRKNRLRIELLALTAPAENSPSRVVLDLPEVELKIRKGGFLYCR